MPLPNFTDIASSEEFKALPHEKRMRLTNAYWGDYERENPGEREFASKQRELSSRFLSLKDQASRADAFTKRQLDAELDNTKFALVASEGIKTGQIGREEYESSLAEHQKTMEGHKQRIGEISGFLNQSKRREDARQSMTEALQKSNLFGSATAAMSGAPDKEIRPTPDGQWDLPLLTQSGGNAVLDTIGGTAVALGQKTGARLDSAGPAVDKQVIQNVFAGLEDNFSKEEVATAWKDLGNMYRKMEANEPARVLSDGTILPNYSSSDWLDKDKASSIIDSLPAPDLAKEIAKSKLPDIQREIADSKLQAYGAASVGTSLQDPAEWARAKGRLEDFGTAEFVKDYEREVANKAGWGQGLVADFHQGNLKLASTLAGVGGLAGWKAAGEAGAELTTASGLVGQGSKDTGLVGSVIEELPSLIAQIALTRGMGGTATALGASEATALKVGTLGALGTAGAQSAGATYSDLIAGGASEEEAREKALKAGFNTALITGLFQKFGAGGVEKVAAGRAAGDVVLRDLFQSASKKELGKNLGKFVGDIAKQMGGEGLEEGLDEFTAAFLNADPDTNLSDAWSNAVEAAKVGAVIGGTVDTISKTFSAPTYKQGLDELEERANAIAKSATQENLPETETAGRAFPTSGPVSLAEIERERAAQIELTEDPEEKKTLTEATPEELAGEWGVDLKLISNRGLEIAASKRRSDLLRKKEGREPMPGEARSYADVPQELTEQEQEELDFLEANAGDNMDHKAVADRYGFDLKPVKVVGDKAPTPPVEEKKEEVAPPTPQAKPTPRYTPLPTREERVKLENEVETKLEGEFDTDTRERKLTKFQKLRKDHQDARRERDDAKDANDARGVRTAEIEMSEIEDRMRELAGLEKVHEGAPITEEEQTKQREFFAKRAVEVQAKLDAGEDLTKSDRMDWEAAGKDPKLLPPTTPAPKAAVPTASLPDTSSVTQRGGQSETSVSPPASSTSDRQQRIQNIKRGDTQSAFALATIAKQEGVDLTTMSREEYVAYAKQQGIRLSDQTLREQPSLRSATSMDEILQSRKALNPQTAEDIKADQDFAIFADSVKQLAEGKGTQHNGEIAPGVAVRSGTKNSSSWLFFGIGKGAGVDSNGDTHKSYIGFKNHYQSLTPARFIAFMSALKNAGFNGDVKSMQDLASQRALSDQIVMHGNSKADADLALQIAESFFGSELSFKDKGVDNKKGGSHSQILANQLSADLDAELNAPAPTTTPTTNETKVQETSRPAPEMMTPEQWVAAGNKKGTQWPMLRQAIKDKKPISYALHNQVVGGTPKGYVRDGEVFRPIDLGREPKDMVLEELTRSAQKSFQNDEVQSKIRAHVGPIFDPTGKTLEKVFRENYDEIRQDTEKARDLIRAKFGDTVTIYRAEDPKAEKTADRSIFSWTLDKATAKKHLVKDGVIREEQVPVDLIEWYGNWREHEVLIDNRKLSKLKDKPNVVYHAGPKEITSQTMEFDRGALGFHVGTKGQAGFVAEGKTGKGDGVISEFEVLEKSPDGDLEMEEVDTDMSWEQPDALLAELVHQGLINDDEAISLAGTWDASDGHKNAMMEAIQKAAKMFGNPDFAVIDEDLGQYMTSPDTYKDKKKLAQVRNLLVESGVGAIRYRNDIEGDTVEKSVVVLDKSMIKQPTQPAAKSEAQEGTAQREGEGQKVGTRPAPKPAQQPKAEEVKTDKTEDVDVASEETVRAVNDAVLEALGLTTEEAQEITGEDLATPEPVSEENPTGPKMDKNGQLELFQEPEPEAPENPAVGRFLRENTEPDESTSGLLEDAGEVLFNDVRQANLSRTGQRVAKLADNLIQNNINKSGNVAVGLVKMYGFLAKVWAMKNRRTPGWPSFLNPKQVANRASILAHEIATSIAKKGSGVDWYRGKIDEMYVTLSRFYPELREPGQERFIFSTILAITSNGENVFNNMNLAVKLYDIVRGQGRMPNEDDASGIAAREKAMFKGFATVQRQIEKDGWDVVDADFKKETSYGDMKKKYGVAKNDEAADVEVSNAYVLGAKIGAFWGNLNGNFKHIAMDLWFTRTMSRIAGDFSTIDPKGLKKYARILFDSDDVPQDVKDELATFVQDISPGEANWTSVPTEIREKIPTAYAWLKQTAGRYASRKDPETGKSFFQGTYTEIQSKKFVEALDKNTNAPKNADHRQWMRDVLNEAKRQLAEAGIELSLAEMQAVMWFHEKDLYTKFGATSKMGERADFAQAAENTMAGRTQFKGDAGPRAEDIDQDLFGREVDAEASREAKKKLLAGRAEQVKEIRGKKGVETLNQDKDPKGQVTFRGLSEAFIKYLKSADGSTAVHEPIHVARRFLLNKNVPAENRLAITDDMIDAANDFVGAKDSNWTVEQEEKFARAFERYLWEGAETGNAKVDTIFSKIRDLLRKVYATIEGSSLDVELTPEIKKLFEQLITRGEKLKEQGAAPTKIPLKVSVEGKAPKPKPASEPQPAPAPKRKIPARKIPVPKTTSVKNAETDKELVAAGFEPIYEPARKALRESLDEALAEVKADPLAGKKLVESILQKPRAINDVDHGLLVDELAKSKVRAANAERAIAKAAKADDSVSLKLAQDERTAALNDIARVVQAAKLAGTEWGRAGRFRQIRIDEDYSIEAMMSRWQTDINEGKPITEDQEKLIKKLRADLLAAEKARKEAENAYAEKKANAILEAAGKKLAKEKPARPRISIPERASRASSAMARLKAKLGVTRLSQVPETDAAYLAAVEAGDMETAQRMVDEAARAAGYAMSHRQAKPVIARKGDVVLFVDDPSANTSYGNHNFAVRDLPEVPAYVRDFSEEYYGEEGQAEPSDILESAQAWDDRQFVSDLWQKFEDRFLYEGIIGFKTPDGGVVFDRPTAIEQNAIKSADPVTYDADGKVIPLSQRFNPESPSILFQDEENTQVEILDDLSEVGLGYFDEGITTLDAFTKKLVADFGEEFRSEAETVFGMTKEKNKKIITRVRQKTPQELASLIDPTKDISERMVYNMALGFMRQGLKGDAVLDAVTKLLRENYPDITREEVVVAFTGYGTVKHPSQEQVKKDLRELKVGERIGAQLLDIAKGFFPKKTGPQHDKTTSPIRSLMKQIKQAMIDAGMNYTDEQDKKTRLAGARDAIKQKLLNEIRDMQNAIDENIRIDRTKRDPVTDEILKDLRARRKEMKEEYDSIFGIDSKKISLEAQIKRASKMLDREIKILEAEARGEILNKPTKVKLDSPELKTKRDRLEALREAKRAAKEALNPKKTSAEIATERLKASAEKSIESFEYFIKNGTYPPKPDGAKATLDDVMKDLLATRDRLRDTVREIQKDRRVLTPPEVIARRRAVTQLNKTIKDLESRIAKRDFSKRAKAPESTDPEIRNLKATVASLRETLDQIKKDALKPVSAEEKRTLRMIAASRARRKKLLLKLRIKDYSKDVRKDPVLDARLAKAVLAEQRAKAAWNKKFFDAELAKRTKLQKVGDAILAPVDAIRTIKTIGDVSAPHRQGIISSVAHPILGLRNYIRMWKAGRRSENLAMQMRELENNKYYEASQRGDKKLFIAKTGEGATMDELEEAFRGRLVDKIPIASSVKGFSERTYNAFLNGMRMDHFAAIADWVTGGDPSKLTKEQASSIANYVNISTGRGNFGKHQGAANLLSLLLFSPKFMVSRFQWITGALLSAIDVVTLFKMHSPEMRKVRQAIAVEYARTVVGMAALYSLYVFGTMMYGGDDDDEEWQDILTLNPLASNFGKIKVGETYVDPAGGLLQTIKFLARTITNKTVTGKGELRSLNDPKYGQQDYADVLQSFIRSKLAPVPSSLINLRAGSNMIGQRATLRSEAVSAIMPMIINDAYEVLRANGMAQGLPLAFLAAHGVGLSTQDDRLSLSQETAVLLGDDSNSFEKKRKKKQEYNWLGF